jgi:hypothetical protein
LVSDFQVSPGQEFPANAPGTPCFIGLCTIQELFGTPILKWILTKAAWILSGCDDFVERARKRSLDAIQLGLRPYLVQGIAMILETEVPPSKIDEHQAP